MKNEVEIKIITLGASGVGKTSLIKRIKFGTFAEKNEATLGVDYFVVKKKYQNKNIMILLKYQDTNGLESMQGIIPQQYIRDSQIVLLVFSNINTLNEVINRWYSFYKENANAVIVKIGKQAYFVANTGQSVEVVFGNLDIANIDISIYKDVTEDSDIDISSSISEETDTAVVDSVW